MNRPNHAILDLLVARHGAWPVLERESQDGRKRAYWAVAPPDDVPAPFLILILEGEGRVLDAIETEIQWYYTACRRRTPYQFPDQRVVIESTVSLTGPKSMLTNRQITILAPTDPFWCRLAIGWMLIPWYIGYDGCDDGNADE